MINAEREILDKMLLQIMDINRVNGYENNLDAVYSGYKEFEKFVNRKKYLIAFIVPDGNTFDIPFENNLSIRKKETNFRISFRWAGDVDIQTSEGITNQCLSMGYDFERWFWLALNLRDVDGVQHRQIVTGDPNIIFTQNVIELYYKVKITLVI